MIARYTYLVPFCVSEQIVCNKKNYQLNLFEILPAKRITMETFYHGKILPRKKFRNILQKYFLQRKAR